MADLNKYAGVALGQGYQGDTETKVPSAVNSAERTMEQARELSGRIQVLADRMLGPTPPSPTSQGIAGKGELMGVLPILQASSDHTQYIINEGFDALNRIERSLP